MLSHKTILEGIEESMLKYVVFQEFSLNFLFDKYLMHLMSFCAVPDIV